jgi:glycosyltransferase involved in cell wall biosynthesis
MSILYLAHGHPRFARGGGELAAYRLFEVMRSQEGFEQTGLLAATPDQSLLPPGCQIMSLERNEWLISRSQNSLLHDSSVQLTQDAHGAVYEALRSSPFQLIHAHHYVHIGLDLLIALKAWFPSCPLVLTLHEYWAMCPYEGRLLRRNGRLCDGPSPRDCIECLGVEQRLPLAVRRLRLQHLFATVDCFISPSSFLKDRYVDWGIQPDRIHVIENLPHHPSSLAREDITESLGSSAKQTLVLAYFGQVNPWKGIDRILDAFVSAHEDFPFIQLHLNGLSWEMLRSGLSHLDPVFVRRCLDLLESAQEGSIVLRGPYGSDELSGRMEDTDVVVMASRWFENAPMVIQESFSHAVPVIAPRLGGMAEKIQHERNGYLFEPASPTGLEEALRWFASNPEALASMCKQAGASALQYQHVLDQHLHVYQQLMQA